MEKKEIYFLVKVCQKFDDDRRPNLYWNPVMVDAAELGDNVLHLISLGLEILEIRPLVLPL